MKKLLGSTLALAMFLSAGANAELLKNLKAGGQLDIQTTSARNVTDFVTRPNTPPTAGAVANNNDRIGSAFARLMLKLDWDLLDDVHGKVTLVKGAANQAASNRAWGAGGENLNAIQTGTFAQEANVKIDKLFGALDTTVGRQFYGDAGDLIVYYGPRDNYGLTVTALDAFRADWNSEHMSVTGIAGKVAGGAITANSTASPLADVDLRGVVISYKMSEMVKPTAYLYNAVAHATGGLGISPQSLPAVTRFGKNTNLWVAGIKAKIAAAGVAASAEFAKNFGEDRSGADWGNYKGYAFQAKAAYKLDLSNVGMIDPWGEFGLGTGDSNGTSYKGNNTFQSIATDYRPGGIYGRFDNSAAVALGSAVTGFGGSSNGLSNRVIWGLGVNVMPAAVAQLTTGVQFYRYAFHRVTPNSAGQMTSRNIGSEVDLTAEWKHSENVSLKAMFGSFKPGAYVADVKGANAALNPAVMLAGDVCIKF